MEEEIKIPLHKAKNITELCSRMRQRAINQARDADFLYDLISGAGKLKENENERNEYT